MQNQDENFYVRRTITLPRTSKLTEEVIQQLDHILEYAPPEEYRNTLIEIYHIYICKEHDSLPYEFHTMAEHMYFLVDFFRRAGEEMNGVGKESQAVSGMYCEGNGVAGSDRGNAIRNAGH